MSLFEFTSKTKSSVLQVDSENQIPINGFYLPVVLMPDNIKIGFRPLNTIEGLTKVKSININEDTVTIDGVTSTATTAKELYDEIESLFFLGEGGGGDFPNPEQAAATLSHFIYNPVTDKLESDRPIETTLSSFFLGNQHRISSGGENVFFTNESSLTNYYPMWGGLKDMNVSSNKGANGIIKPSGRNYSNFSIFELNGVVDTGVTDAINQAIIPVNVSGVGANMVIEDTISPSDILLYKIWYGNDDTGSQAFESKKRGLTLSPGDAFEWIYEHPVETKANQAIYARIDIEDTEGNQRTLQVRKAVNGAMWVAIQAFQFTDDDLAYKSDIEGIVSGSIYKGAYNAETDTPSLTLTGTEVNGQFYRVSAAGGIYEVGDLIIYNSTTVSYDNILVRALTQTQIESSSLKVYDVYVKANFAGATKDGSALYPYSEIQAAVNAASDTDSIYLDGVFNIANEIIIPSNKSLYFYGSDTTEVKYSSYSATNANIISFDGDGTKELKFVNIKFKNAGGYALYLKNLSESIVENCDFKNNGWDGLALNTIVSSSVSGLLGYDSTQAELQAFYAGPNASNGGAVRIENSKVVELIGNVVSKNLRGLRIQDCGVGGYGYVTRNQVSENIESGIYLASSSYDATNGCENFTVYNNACKYNANNGNLVIGGINNVVSLNIVEGNWNAGVMGWHVSNTRFRDLDLTNNNRSQYNGIGNTGDAHASIAIGGDTARTDRGYIVSILSCEVYNTGLGSNTSRIGFQVLEDVEDITGTYEENLINIDDSGFHKQDYSIDVLANLSNVKLSIGDCRYLETVETNINIVSGAYYEQPFSNHITNLKDCDFSVEGESVILKEGINGVRLNPYTLHDLTASLNGSSINIFLSGSEKIQFNLNPNGASIDGVLLVGTPQIKVNQINTLLQNSGTPTDNLPSITSSLGVSILQGQTLNYELTADFGVGYEWDFSSVSGIANVEGNVRKIIGGSSLATGVYSIPVKAINYNGEDSQTIELTVGNPAFANTKSLNFNNSDWLGANAGILQNVLGRTANGSGSGDAWTISMFFKPGTATNTNQTVFYFGNQDVTNQGNIQIRYNGQGNNKRFEFRYGSNNNRLTMLTPNNSLSNGVWSHLIVTYNGGTTGASSGSINNYYNRFKFFINGVQVSTTNNNSNFGYTGSIQPQNLRVGRWNNGQYMRNNCRVDELAVWDSDQSANASLIYGGGSATDLSLLSTEPKHWWRMGDGDSYPYIFDNGSEANCIFQMNNMTAADIVSDTP